MALRAQSEARTLSITPRVGTIFSNISNESMGLGLPGNLSKGKTKVGLWAGADARHSFGLTNLYKGPLDKKCKNRGVTVSVGYKFDLTNL